MCSFIGRLLVLSFLLDFALKKFILDVMGVLFQMARAETAISLSFEQG